MRQYSSPSFPALRKHLFFLVYLKISGFSVLRIKWKCLDTLLENALLLTVFRKVSEDKRGTEKCECLDFSSKLLWMLISCVKLFFGHFVQQSCAIDVVTCRQTFTNGLQLSRPWIEGVRREEHSWFVWRCLPMQAIAIACKLDHCLTCINQWKLVIR